MEHQDEQNFYKKMNEIGDYTYENKMDTVFVFQLIFISILIIIALLYLRSINVSTSYFVYPMIVLIAIVDIFILVNRIVLTDKIRNKTHWSELNFGDGSIAPSDYISAGTANGTKGLINMRAPPPACPSGQHMANNCVPN